MVVAALPIDLPPLVRDLDLVESALRASVVADDPFLEQVAQHLIRAGGKRLRPVLTLASAYAGGATASDDVVQGAVAVELVHLGSLYHDDVMDESMTRRGQPTANARHGNFVAIVAGDYCLARSAQIAARLGTAVAGLLGATIGRLCEGQVGELHHLYSPDRPEVAYFTSIAGKTASLMAAACRVGALTTGLSDSATDALTRFGDRVGMVFQVVDDILDVVATDEQLGKPAGNDLLEGVYTLPVLRGLLDPAIGEELRAALVARVDRAGLDRVRKLVRASSGIESAVAVARGLADEAAGALAPLPETNARREMAGLGHVLIDRLPL